MIPMSHFVATKDSQKHTLWGTFKLTIPAHRPIKRSTLAHIIKEAKLTVDQFNDEGSVPIFVLNERQTEHDLSTLDDFITCNGKDFRYTTDKVSVRLFVRFTKLIVRN